jgi:hypothetical protein
VKSFELAVEKDIVMLEDGDWYYWPVNNNGAYSARTLKAIATLLDRKNT